MAKSPRKGPTRRPTEKDSGPEVERGPSGAERLTERFDADLDQFTKVDFDDVTLGSSAGATGEGTSRRDSVEGGPAASGANVAAGRVDGAVGDEIADLLGVGDDEQGGGIPTVDAKAPFERPTRESLYSQMTDEMTPDNTDEAASYDKSSMFAADPKKNVVTGNAAAYAVTENKDGEAVKVTNPFDLGVAVDAPGMMMGGLSNEYVAPPPEPKVEPKVKEPMIGKDYKVEKFADGRIVATNWGNETVTTLWRNGATETKSTATGKVIDTTKPLVKDSDQENYEDPGVAGLRALGRVLGVDPGDIELGGYKGDGHTDPTDPTAGGVEVDGGAGIDYRGALVGPSDPNRDPSGGSREMPTSLNPDSGVTDPSDPDDVVGRGSGPEEDPFGEERPDLTSPLDDPVDDPVEDPGDAQPVFRPVVTQDDLQVDVRHAADIMDLDG